MKALTWKCRTKISIRFQNFRVTYPKTYINLVLFSIFCILFSDKTVDDSPGTGIDRADGLLGPAPNAYGSPDCAKRPNPFRSNSQDILHSLQQPQMLLHPNLPIPRSGPRPLLDIPTGFNNTRPPFLGHHNSIMPDIDPNTNQPQNPFLLNSPRGLSPHVNQTHSPQMNFRNNNNQPIRGNSPYFRNQKGPMRGGAFRPNFRGGNRNW